MAAEKFSEVPTRTEGGTFRAEWVNILKRAGQRLENILGNGITEVTTFTIADNQSSYANITGMSIDGASYVFVKFRYTIYRFDGSSDERRESGILELEYLNDAGTWRIARREGSSDALNIADSMYIDNNAGVGQVQYKSDSMGGTYTGTIDFKILETIGVAA